MEIKKITCHPGPQEEALQRLEFEVLYGGARGGGKTFTGILWLLYDTDNPKYRALVIRRNFSDLNDWIDRAKDVYTSIGATLVNGEFIFRSGAKIRLGHLGDDNSYSKYQGHEYHRILIEELTQIPTEELYMKLISSCRSTVDGLTPQVFATTNPGNIGHLWVKKRFVDCVIPGLPYTDPLSGRARIFIQAKVEDNPTLMEKDPEYVKFLDSLPEDLRKARRDGSWDVFDSKGSFYSSYILEARKQNRICKIPYESTLPTYKFWDLGIDDNMVCLVVQFFGKELRLIDCIYGTDMGFEHYIPIVRERYGLDNMYFPHDIEVRELTSGSSRKETLEKMGVKVNVTPNIAVEEGIHSARLIFNNIRFDEAKCDKLIEALNIYRKKRDEKNLVFGKPIHDWSSDFADAFRYMAVNYNRLIKPKSEQPKKQSYYIDQRTGKVVYR